MKLCNIYSNKDFVIHIDYLQDSPGLLTVVISDLELDCPYYVWKNLSISPKASVWVAPLSDDLRKVAEESNKFSGFRCKVYSRGRLLQVEELPYNAANKCFDQKFIFTAGEMDQVGPSYLDFFHGDLCSGIDTSGVVIDAGANIGLFTLYALHNGADRVYSIEPDSSPFYHLKQNFKHSSAVIPINKALTSDCNGTHFFHVVDYSVASSQRKTENYSIKGFVETIDLPTILSIESKVNLVKLDIEGSEFEVLDKLPAECFNKINQFLIEFHHTPLPLIQKLHQMNFKTEFRKSTENDIAGNIYAYR